MNARTDIQLINGPDGKPAFVVIPYADYLAMEKKAEPTIPNEVVGLMIDHDYTPARAWREHLRLTQTEVAERLGISQSAYAQQESSTKLRKSSLEKIAAALGISVAQLDV
ncbi:helix-turn-helix domain-containing protein [Cupriavidus nantongensis]|uniref:Transcriptional regulator n=1 Tax=Cupriavidus nantongensis TaxID=1796606 RepID=A0A142JHV3_9BURK|nr:helix-turn-helix transcriptional regulator [Cupriavidus nantongensis]AMR77665.1 transcriptional regulator [Cupriavidus nantongensis]